VIGWRLVSDVGGSNARFARALGNTLSERRNYAVQGYATYYHALRQYLADTGGAAGCASGAIDVAGPVDGGRAKLTNASWVIDAKEIGQLLGGVPAELVNDLQAAAMALPHLLEKDLTPLGGSFRGSGGRRTMLALNVGTGFGAAAVVPTRDGWTACACEPGHMALGAVDADQLSVVEGLATVENALSGRGVQALYARLAARRGVTVTGERSGADIFAAMRNDVVAAETVHHFSRLLGRVAGDLVLATGAWGGVFLCGSVVQGWADVANIGEFRADFEHEGAMRERMRGVYSGVIEVDDISLIGLTHLGVGT
jgi:glucokinase